MARGLAAVSTGALLFVHVPGPPAAVTSPSYHSSGLRPHYKNLQPLHRIPGLKGLARSAAPLSNARPHQHPTLPRRGTISSSVRTVAALAPSASIPSTEVLANFLGTDLPGQVTRFGTDQAGEPPDTQIAVGPNSVVEATNASLYVWSKTGAFVAAADLNVMFGLPPGYAFSDPRILYDSPSGRWFLTGLAFGATSNVSLLAVSGTSDPTGSWVIYFLTTSPLLPDQPKVGVSADKLVISWNDFSDPTTFAGEETLVVQKSDLVSGISPIRSVNFGGPGSPDVDRFGLVPAVEQSPTNSEFIVYNRNLLPGGSAHAVVGRITGTPADGNVTWLEVFVPISATSTPPKAAQPGSALIETNDDRFLSADWREGTLWIGGNDACIPSGDTTVRSCLRLVAANANDIDASLAKELDFGAASAYAYFPAVASDPTGNLFVSFSGSAATLNPSAEAISIPVVGSITAVLVGQGLGPYDTATGCHGFNRWGDYSGAAVDATNPNDIWVASERAASATNSCYWGTAIARLTLAPPTISALAPFMGSIRGGTTVTISGADFKPGGTTVSFSGTPLAPASVTIDSPEQIRVVTPPHPGCGSVPVVVTTGNGASSPVTFGYAGWPCAASQVTASGGFRSRLLPPKVR